MKIFGINFVTDKKLHAMKEGQIDILTPPDNTALLTNEVVDRNNYRTYDSMVRALYDMYNGSAYFGPEIARGIIDTRVSFIGGEGLSVIAEKKATQDYINKFLDLNNYDGSKLIESIEIGEKEGKDLIVLTPDKGYIKAINMSYKKIKYKVTADPNDYNNIISCTFKDGDNIERTFKINRLVYVKLGGDNCYDVNNTPNRLHCVLTDIENYSRAKYDLRKNSHLFSKIMPYFKTQTGDEAKSINKAISNKDFSIGAGYAGTADFSLVGPPLGAYEQIKGEMLLYLKNISTTSGIPIHWMAWPELMSNRATAENLLEVINSATRKERLLWEEAYKDVIKKSMILAIDSGFERENILGDFQVKLPLISMANLKAIQETWLPLQQMDVISMSTLRNKIPDINPSEEEKYIKKEKESNVGMFNDILMNRSGDDTRTNPREPERSQEDDNSVEE